MSKKAPELRVRNPLEKMIIRKSLSLFLKKRFDLKTEMTAIQLYQKLQTK